MNFGENWIAVDPHGRLRQDASRRSRRSSTDTPAMFHDVQTYLNERIDEVLTGSSDPIVVRIFGNDLDVLRQQADEVRDAISRGRRRSDPFVEFQEGVPQVQVTVKLAQAQHYGLKPGDVRRAAATLMESEEVGDIFRGGRAYDVHVWSTPATRNSVSSLLELPLDTPERRARGHAATWRTSRSSPTPNVIHHEGASRSIDIAAGVDGRDLGAVAGDVQERLDDDQVPARLPRGVPRRVQGAAGRPERPAPLRHRRGARDLPAPAGLVPQLAAGDPVLLHAADGARRRRCWPSSSAPTASSRSARSSASSRSSA